MSKGITVEIHNKDDVQVIVYYDGLVIDHHKPYDKIIIKHNGKITHKLLFQFNGYFGLEKQRYKSSDGSYELHHEYFTTGRMWNNMWIKDRDGVLIWAFTICPKKLNVKINDIVIQVVSSDSLLNAYNVDVLDPSKIDRISVSKDNSVVFCTEIEPEFSVNMFLNEPIVTILVSRLEQQYDESFKEERTVHDVSFPINSHEFHINNIKIDPKEFSALEIEKGFS